MFSNHEPAKLKKLRSELKKLTSELATLTRTEQQLHNLSASENSDTPVIFGTIAGLSLFFGLLDYEDIIFPYPIYMTAISIPLAYVEHLFYKTMNTANPNLCPHSKQTLVQIINDYQLDVKITDDKRSILPVTQKIKDKIEACSISIEKCSKAVSDEEKQYQAFLDDSFDQYQKNKTGKDAKDEPAIPSKRF